MNPIKEHNENEIADVTHKRRLSKKTVILLTIAVLILCVVAAVWVSWHTQAKQKAEIEKIEAALQELVDTPIAANSASPEIILDIVNSDIKKIGELATVEYLFTDSARFNDSNILKWNGVIKAGVNIEKISVEVNPDDGIIIISMPDAEILSYSVDNDSVEVLDEKDNIFKKITIDDKVKFDTSTEEEMKERAIENGLLEKAQKNAEEIMESLLMANPAIRDGYKIEFVSSSGNS